MDYKNVFKKQEYYEISYGDFESIVRVIYKQSYDFVADIEGSNDSEYKYSTDNDISDEWDQNKLNKFKTTGEYQYLAPILIADLANRDLIPKGNILITVSW